MIWGGTDLIIIEIKYTINVMHFNHPKTIPCTLVCGKTIFHETSPLCQKGWVPLLRTVGGNVNWCSHCGEKKWRFLKTLTRALPYQVWHRGPDTEKLGMSQGKAGSLWLAHTRPETNSPAGQNRSSRRISMLSDGHPPVDSSNRPAELIICQHHSL